MFSPMEIAAVVGVAILIFGADKLPKLAKSAGQAKKEFMIGQAEADVAAEKAREEARKTATANVEATAAAGTTPAAETHPGAPAPVPPTATTTAAPPHAG
jgi:sec-independent protein translocase protein TatA